MDSTEPVTANTAQTPAILDEIYADTVQTADEYARIAEDLERPVHPFWDFEVEG